MIAGTELRSPKTVRMSPCRTCSGTKIVHLALGRRATCPTCDGTGLVRTRQWGVTNTEQTNKRRRGWRKLRASLGLCAQCDDPAWVDERGRKHSLCKFHYEKAPKTDPEAVRLLRKERREAGMCTECKDPTPVYVDSEGKRHSQCRHHFELQQKRMTKYNKKRKSAGKCFCGAKAKPGRDRCATCLSSEIKRVRLQKADRKAKNLCTKCGKRKPMVRRQWCAGCLKVARDQYRTRRQLSRFKVERRGQLARALNATSMLMT